MVRLRQGGCCWQLRGRGRGVSLCQFSLIICDVSMLDHCQKTHKIHTQIQRHTYANTLSSLMIQSCDCRLPAMIEPHHSPAQHKSMSITSPEHIRHFPFLLVISMAHRHIPIQHQALCEASAHKQQSQGMK